MPSGERSSSSRWCRRPWNLSTPGPPPSTPGPARPAPAWVLLLIASEREEPESQGRLGVPSRFGGLPLGRNTCLLLGKEIHLSAVRESGFSSRSGKVGRKIRDLRFSCSLPAKEKLVWVENPDVEFGQTLSLSHCNLQPGVRIKYIRPVFGSEVVALMPIAVADSGTLKFVGKLRNWC